MSRQPAASAGDPGRDEVTITTKGSLIGVGIVAGAVVAVGAVAALIAVLVLAVF